MKELADFIELHSADKYNAHETYLFRKTAINGLIKVENSDYSVVLVGMGKYLVRETYEEITKILGKGLI